MYGKVRLQVCSLVLCLNGYNYAGNYFVMDKAEKHALLIMLWLSDC